MVKKHHIYLLKNGRISMAGVNTKNVKYIASAIADAVNST
jgi:aspartate/tyrosine/aromatic aminotransferase